MARLRLAWAILLLAAADVGSSTQRVLIQEAVLPAEWHVAGRAPESQNLELVVALRNWNMSKLDAEVLAVSSPHSPRYGQHLRPGEVADLTTAAPEAQVAVTSWLQTAGLRARPSRWGDRVHVWGTVSEVEALFATQIVLLEKAAELPVLHAGDLYAHAGIAASVAAVFGLHGTPLRRPQPPAGSIRPVHVNPETLRELHEVSGVEVSRGGENRRAAVEFHDQRASSEDVRSFFERFVQGAESADANFSCMPEPCREGTSSQATTELEYLMGSAPGVNTEVWSFSGASWCTNLKNWTSQILDSDAPPLVFTVGYGIQGNVSRDHLTGCSPQMVQNIEDDFIKIAARGITIIFASGDEGGGPNRQGKLWPSWPSSAPHVTSVGATQLEGRWSQQQRAVIHFGSGGGFSWRAARPSWQNQAVEGYLQRARQPRSKDFARQGRAVPDLAALGEGFEAIAAGREILASGTAAGAPFIASLVSLLNEYRLQQHQSPLGFLNPLLYEMAQSGKGFVDITRGTNRQNSRGIPQLEGYSCTEGWDAVTGWGVPRFQDMLEYVKSLPPGQRQLEIQV